MSLLFWATLASIMFTPRLGISLRLEDLIAFTSAPYVYYKIVTYGKAPILISFAVFHLYLIYSLFVTSISMPNELLFNTFLVMAREWSYFILGGIFLLYFRMPNSLADFERILIWLSMVPLFYGVFDVFAGTITSYGVGYFTDPNNPTGSATLFLTLGLVHLLLAVKNGRTASTVNSPTVYKHVIFSATFFLLLILTGSRTNLLQLLFIGALILSLTSIRLLAISVSIIIIGTITTVHLIEISDISDTQLLINIGSRLETIFNLMTTLESSRLPWWQDLWIKFITGPLGGCGKACTHDLHDGVLSTRLAADSGYLKFLVEVGILGTVLYYTSHAAIALYVIPKRGIFKSLGIGFFLSIFLVEISFESLQTTRGSFAFWIVSAVLLGLKFAQRRQPSL